MAHADTTKVHILRAAIAILKQVGMEGFTMRGVASEAGMSLGNLQYHFKDKAALMAGLAEHYFAECSGMLDAYTHTPVRGSGSKKLTNLLLFFLENRS